MITRDATSGLIRGPRRYRRVRLCLSGALLSSLGNLLVHGMSVSDLHDVALNLAPDDLVGMS